MRAITLHQRRLIFDSNYDPPSPLENESLVEVIQAGICETDLQLTRGYMNFAGILGHEFVGVARSGPFENKRVVGEINCNCQSCPRCNVGMGNHCANRTVLGIYQHDGAFADFVAVPHHNLHVLPDTVSDDEAVFVEPLAAAFQILQQISVSANDSVLICGDGRLSLMCASVLKLTGASITVIGKHPAKLDRFELLNVQTQLLSQQDDEYKLFDVVVDCTGSSSGLELALNRVRPCGTVVLKTTVAADHQLSLAKIVIDEINVVGSRCGPFDKAIDALEDKRVDVDRWITDRFPIESGVQAFEQATAPESLKVVLDINKVL